MASVSDAIIIASVQPPLVGMGASRLPDSPGANTPSTSTMLCQSCCQGTAAIRSAGPTAAPFTGRGGCGTAKGARATGAMLVYFHGSLPRRAVGSPSRWKASHPRRRRSGMEIALPSGDCAA